MRRPTKYNVKTTTKGALKIGSYRCPGYTWHLKTKWKHYNLFETFSFQVYLLTSPENKKACLGIFFNHAIVDGMSAQIVINQILETYTQISTTSLESVQDLNSWSDLPTC